MFSVPGWSVSAASLQAEGAKDGKKGGAGGGGDKSSSSDQNNNHNKRKRQSGPSNVTADNVAGLWESVIEGKSGKKPRLESGPPAMSRKEKKRANKAAALEKQQAEGGAPAAEDAAKAPKDGAAKSAKDTAAAASDPAPKDDVKESKKDKKKKRKSKGDQSEDHDEQQPSDTKKDASKPAAPVVAVAAPVPASPKLTPLQASMREKLISARFRHLNETLYTRPSAEAFDLFEESPEMFQEYHEGFRRQVNVWPENPVDGYIADIKARGRQRQAPRDSKGKPSSSSSSSALGPLLRTERTCTIADLGCGDAKLAETLQADSKKLNLKILSYDLQSPSPLVTRADIANLPLEDGSVNVVIFCLALMGTNWPAFIDEAYRILHWKGELWIAEIKSRFTVPASAAAKKGKPVVHSVGNLRKKQQAGKKGGKVDAEDHDEALAVEVDGAEARRQETDVSAFIEALRKRGFLLQAQGGRDAVDMSNKMFVKMNFIKAAAPVVGKNVVADKEQPARGGAKKGSAKFIDAKDSSAVDESSILKPCVYKIR